MILYMRYIKVFEDFYEVNEIGYRPIDNNEITSNTQNYLNDIFFKELGKSEPNFEIIENLLKNKIVDINCKGIWNRTALHLSAYYNHINIIKMLLELGIDIESLDIWDKTALHVASFYNRFEIIQMLLNKGSDNNKKDSYGKTAWDYANEFIKISLPELKPKNKE